MATAAEPVPPAVQALVRDLVQRYAAECFWDWDASRPIADRAVVLAVVRRLRVHGGRSGWRAAAEVVRCL